MSDLQGWFIVSFLFGFFSGIIFYIIKDMINQFKKINELKKEIEKIS
jgi:phage shock protein PspC (stress-responsive transcriptional regulator)